MGENMSDRSLARSTFSKQNYVEARCIGCIVGPIEEIQPAGEELR
jgi:hypothetical protein